MKRIRFKVNIDAVNADYRCVIFMTAYPYWCSGETDDDFIIVCYAENETQVMMQWPEAHDIDVLDNDCEITFDSRFIKPSWYTKDVNKIIKGHCCWNCKHKSNLLTSKNKTQFCNVSGKNVRLTSLRTVTRKCCEFD